jgi:hypothetical protein
MKVPTSILKKLLFTFIVCLSFFKASANTFETTQNGNWEDSTSWNNVNVPTDFTGSSSYDDTIIIRHHITFSNPLQMHFVIILLLDSGASICGYDSIHLWNSEMIQMHATIFCYWFYLDSSYWFCDGGFSIFRMGMRCNGENPFAGDICGRMIGEGSRSVIGLRFHFTCSIPPIYWEDIIPPPPPTPVYLDTVEVSVDPNQSFNNFSIKTYLSEYHTSTIAEVFDLLGIRKLILHIPVQGATQTIYADDWAAGIYILRVSENGTVFRVFRLLKVR